jgi:hypothetical protein
VVINSKIISKNYKRIMKSSIDISFITDSIFQINVKKPPVER